MRIINSPAWALNLEVQAKLHRNSVWKQVKEVSEIVNTLTVWWTHPFEAQLAAPIMHYNSKR